MNLGPNTRPRIAPPAVFAYIMEGGEVVFSSVPLGHELLQGRQENRVQLLARNTASGFVPVHLKDAWALTFEAKAHGATPEKIAQLMHQFHLRADEVITMARRFDMAVHSVGQSFEARWNKKGVAFRGATPLEAVGGLVALLMHRGDI